MSTAAVNEAARRAAEPAEQAWPAPDFLDTASRLRHELDAAIRVEQQKTQMVADIQSTAFAKALPVALVAGGKDELKKLSDAHNSASLDVQKKREALRNFLNSERAGFFSLRDQAYSQLRSGISERFARAQKAATELRAALDGLLGAEAEAEREEKLIRAWNREVRKFNRLIPAVNVNAIPSAAGIGVGESCRTAIEGLILQDSGLREFCRESLAREAERRERIAANDEARIAQNEARANPPD